MTVLAGVIAKKFGPVVGGLFLAFPAIFPASATLIEKHERERKERKGLKGDAASLSRRECRCSGMQPWGALGWPSLHYSFGRKLQSILRGSYLQLPPLHGLWCRCCFGKHANDPVISIPNQKPQ